MRIAVLPQWTFVEAVEAAWGAYRGGREHGVPNRIRVLEQWANVVGKERALAELDQTITSYGSIQKASEELGFSIYALKKLKGSFSGMPSITPHTTPVKTFEELLRRLPNMEFENEFTFMVQVIPRFASFLGYAESEVFFETIVPGIAYHRVDVILAPLGVSRPHILIELKRYSKNEKIPKDIVDRTEKLRATSGAALGLILSPYQLIILSSEKVESFDLDSITKENIEAVRSRLQRPGISPPGQSPSPAPAPSELTFLLEKVTTAKTNEEKKNSLETLAKRVFEVHEFISCKYQNLRTNSSEIDIVCEAIGGISKSFLGEYGRYFLVECKNWGSPAGAKEVRDFLGKVRKCRIKLGVFFSRNGITGEQNGTDALREIHSAYDQDGISIVVVSEQDLSAIKSLTDVLEIIDEKLDAVRFDF